MSEDNIYNEAGKILSGETKQSPSDLDGLREIWDFAGKYQYPEEGQTQAAWDAFKSSEIQKPVMKVSWFKRNYIAAAASIALLLVGGIGAWLSTRNTVELSPAQQFSTTNNTFKTVELPDGSSIALNANTQIVIAEGYGQANRNIELIGEAVFEVARNEDLPFIVTAGSTKTRVLGTGFDIKAYPNEKVIIVVKHGKVGFSAQKNELILFKGNGAVYEPQNGSLSVIENAEIPVWENGEWVLKSTKVSDIADMFNHRFGKKLVFDAKDGDRVFTGKFASGTSAEDIVKTIAQALQISLSIQ